MASLSPIFTASLEAERNAAREEAEAAREAVKTAENERDQAMQDAIILSHFLSQKYLNRAGFSKATG